jgi:hypothetical protein
VNLRKTLIDGCVRSGASVSRLGAGAAAPAETAKTSAHDSVSREALDNFMAETIRRQPLRDKRDRAAAATP